PALGLLAVAWWRLDDRNDAYRHLVWASTLTWTVVANLYVGVYDSVLVVPAALLAAEALLRREGEAGPALPLGLQAWLILLYTVPWFSQHLARWGGVQPYTLVLLAFAVHLQAQARRLAEPDGREERRVPQGPPRYAD